MDTLEKTTTSNNEPEIEYIDREHGIANETIKSKPFFISTLPIDPTVIGDNDSENQDNKQDSTKQKDNKQTKDISNQEIDNQQVQSVLTKATTKTKSDSKTVLPKKSKSNETSHEQIKNLENNCYSLSPVNTYLNSNNELPAFSGNEMFATLGNLIDLFCILSPCLRIPKRSIFHNDKLCSLFSKEFEKLPVSFIPVYSKLSLQTERIIDISFLIFPVKNDTKISSSSFYSSIKFLLYKYNIGQYIMYHTNTFYLINEKGITPFTCNGINNAIHSYTKLRNVPYSEKSCLVKNKKPLTLQEQKLRVDTYSEIII